MGMDVYGHSPKTEEGEYFRANVWGWRPIWDYCVQMHPHLVGDEPEYGHYNDGYGLDEEGATRLGEAIEQDLRDGRAHAYIESRNKYLAKLERPECDWCDKTGIRTDKVGVDMGMPEKALDAVTAIMVGRTHGWCNGCNGEGRQDHPETLYSLEIGDLDEFAVFLINSGGFGIH